jgi:hypothetical protein
MSIFPIIIAELTGEAIWGLEDSKRGMGFRWLSVLLSDIIYHSFFIF